jgi:hypothetical protein
MTIAILGWGSLIWDRRDLPVSGEWQRGGPVVSIEFSRISKNSERAGCLTLVIDEQHGTNVTTRFARSPRTNLDDAIADLRVREGTMNASLRGSSILMLATLSRRGRRHRGGRL